MASFLSIPVNYLFNVIGHDGSDIVNNQPEPLCRRAFHLAEVVAAGIKLGYPLLTIETIVEGEHLYNKEQLEVLLNKDNLMLYGIVNDQVHAVHCSHKWIYDPNGTAYSPKEFEVHALVERIDECTKRLLNICQLQKDVPRISTTKDST